MAQLDNLKAISVESTSCAINCVRTAKIRHLKIFALAGWSQWDSLPCRQAGSTRHVKTGAAPACAGRPGPPRNILGPALAGSQRG